MILRILSAVLLTILAGAASAQTPNNTKIKVLILTGGHGFQAEPFFQMFRDNPDITFVTAAHEKTAEGYDRDDLYTFNVVVLYDAQVNITEAQQARFLALFDKGIGVVILHHAYLSYPMWAEYGRIAGGKYIYREEQRAQGFASSHYRGDVDIPVTIAAKDHPVTAGLQDFLLKDELYTEMYMLDNITPLLKTGDELLAWTRIEKKSRIAGTILGHGPTAFQNPNFRKFLAQSIRWVAQGQPSGN